MRILQMTDLHGADRCLEESRAWAGAHEPDLFLATGDLTNFGPLGYVRDLLEGFPCRTLALPGNCDPREVVPLLEALGVSLHGRRAEVAGETLVGLGGSSPTPFHTPFELSEEEIEASLRPLMVPGAVLATHSPPHGSVDVVPGGGHAGSRAVRRLVEEFVPKAVLCGHIHEARGVEGEAPVCVNPGPASRGYGALVDVGEEVEVTLLP